MKYLLITLLISLSLPTYSQTIAEGVIVKSSLKSVKEIKSMALGIFKKKGLTVFTVIDHHKGARSIGEELEDTSVIIFGNPKLGTPLMKNARTVAIDLPQKLLIYAQGNKSYILYNDPAYLQKRHGLRDLPQLAKITKALDAITTKLAN